MYLSHSFNDYQLMKSSPFNYYSTLFFVFFFASLNYIVNEKLALIQIRT